MSDYMSLQQVADHLQVSIHTVRGWIKKPTKTNRPQLAFVKAGGRTLVTKDAVESFLKQSTAQSADQAA